MKNFKLSLLISLLSLINPIAGAKNRLSLDDVEIKGELHNDGLMRINGKEAFNLENFVKLRKDFRNEILEEHPSATKYLKISK